VRKFLAPRALHTGRGRRSAASPAVAMSSRREAGIVPPRRSATTKQARRRSAKAAAGDISRASVFKNDLRSEPELGTSPFPRGQRRKLRAERPLAGGGLRGASLAGAMLKQRSASQNVLPELVSVGQSISRTMPRLDAAPKRGVVREMLCPGACAARWARDRFVEDTEALCARRHVAVRRQVSNSGRAVLLAAVRDCVAAAFQGGRRGEERVAHRQSSVARL
jgi:hypothetical protein